MTARRLLNFLVCTFILFMASSVVVFGQPGDPGNPDNPVPITGVEYLLGGGLFYGIRSLLKARKKIK